MRLFVPFLALILAPSAALARPWNGITPGVSMRDEVVKQFGEPTKSVQKGDKAILAYLSDRAIKGTTQAQFTVTAAGVVEQISVFPAAPLEVSDIEDMYGKACSAVEKPGVSMPNCYVKQLTDDFRTFFTYKRTGVMVFFNEDKRSVYSIAFTAPSATAAPK